jgi:hypothetical protein
MLKLILVSISTHIAMISSSPAQSTEELKKKFILEDGIYIESLLSNNTPNAYSIDNKIYIINKQFIFDYHIERFNKVLKIVSPKNVKAGDDYQRAWGFIAENESHSDKIELISIKILSGISNDNQTLAKYNYQYQFDSTPFQSESGIVDNQMNVWMHPHRDKYFMILELNPFPYIQQPYKIGNKWNWSLDIGDHWSDNRWKTWSGKITNKYKYEIIGLKKLKTKVGELDCWVVKGIASNELGQTEMIAYFNEQNGFVKMDFVNIDKSKVVIEIHSIK